MRRRDFVRTSAAAATGAALSPMILPRHVLGGSGFRAPSDRLRLAAIGAGGMGAQNMSRLTTEHIVALADIDFGYVDGGIERRLTNRDGSRNERWHTLQAAYAEANRYADFRELLDAESDLDGVVISTPDHVHALAALMAMERGLHVYAQKPLCYSVEECRRLAHAAESTGLVTQMGNQGHSGDDGRRLVELVRSGLLGEIREIQCWTDRPAGWWGQGIDRPAPQDPPDGVAWDLFLGPAPEQPFYEGTHPFGWRGWVDFGVGALGDMGAHILDFPVWALGLGQPRQIQTRRSPWGGERGQPPVTYPVASMTTYVFDRADIGQGDGGDLTFTWYDGGLRPPTPAGAPDGFALNPDGGGIFVGERGKLVYDTYGRNPRLLAADGNHGALQAEAEAVPVSLPRIEGSMGAHEQNWVRAIHGEEPVSCPFSYAAPLTETMLLGVAAMYEEKPVLYDADAMRITNAPAADAQLRRTYRSGWDLPAESVFSQG
ncbi:MAG: Gfo/Idh/MocA family oxidoreductase [Bacteroidota bacterium]